ncbi:MAG: hypothetical protein JWQ63_4100 [Mucilaginibacter sp.]|jgi:hypothetical protein|nr:hypothetical protein [Mucilaginibacter sp.]
MPKCHKIDVFHAIVAFNDNEKEMLKNFLVIIVSKRNN